MMTNNDITSNSGARPPPGEMIDLSRRKKAVIYARASTLAQEVSVASQVDCCTTFIERNGLILARSEPYSDEGYTGRNDRRPGLKALMADLKSPDRDWDLVIVMRFCRFFRNERLFLQYEFKLRDYDAFLLSASDSLLNNTHPTTKMFRHFAAIQAEEESYTIGQHVKRGRQTVVKRAIENKEAVFMGGVPPLGFDAVDGVLMINPTEKVIINKLFDLRVQGLSLQKIADKLNEQGYVTKAKNKFTQSSIRELITNPAMCGDMQYGRYGYSANGKLNRHSIRDESEIQHIPCPAIITPEQWQKAQPKPENKRKTSSTRYLLSGLVVCGECQQKGRNATMHANRRKNSKGAEYRSFYCPSNKKNKSCDNREIDMKKLEDFIITQVKDIVFSEKNMKKYIEALPKLNTGYNADLAKLKTQRKKLDKKIEELLNKLEADCPKEAAIDVNKRIGLRSKERNAVQKEIDRLENLAAHVPSADEISIAKAVFEEFIRDEINYEYSHRLIFSLVEEIMVNNDRVEVAFY